MAIKKPESKSKSPVKSPVKKVQKALPIVPEVEEPEEEELPTHPPEVEEPPAEVEEPPEPIKPPKSDGPGPKPAVPDDDIKLDKDRVLGFLEDIIDTLTFKRVGLIALLTAIGLGLYALFENRSNVIERVIQPAAVIAPVGTPQWELSDRSKATLQTFAKSTDVALVVVSDVDLQKNRRTVRYYYIDDVVNIKLEPAALQTMSLPQTMFDYDAKNTAQMVAVLSNEFRCDPYKDTAFFHFAPELAEKLPIVCRLAIPPFVGQFAGFLTVAAARNLNRMELDTIRLEASRIAAEIYTNDVIKKPLGQ